MKLSMTETVHQNFSR